MWVLMHVWIGYCWSKQRERMLLPLVPWEPSNGSVLSDTGALAITELFLLSTNCTWPYLGPSRKSVTYSFLSLMKQALQKCPSFVIPSIKYMFPGSSWQQAASMNGFSEGVDWKLAPCWVTFPKGTSLSQKLASRFLIVSWSMSEFKPVLYAWQRAHHGFAS